MRGFDSCYPCMLIRPKTFKDYFKLPQKSKNILRKPKLNKPLVKALNRRLPNKKTKSFRNTPKGVTGGKSTPKTGKYRKVRGKRGLLSSALRLTARHKLARSFRKPKLGKPSYRTKLVLSKTRRGNRLSRVAAIYTGGRPNFFSKSALSPASTVSLRVRGRGVNFFSYKHFLTHNCNSSLGFYANFMRYKPVSFLNNQFSGISLLLPESFIWPVSYNSPGFLPTKTDLQVLVSPNLYFSRPTPPQKTTHPVVTTLCAGLSPVYTGGLLLPSLYHIDRCFRLYGRGYNITEVNYLRLLSPVLSQTSTNALNLFYTKSKPKGLHYSSSLFLRLYTSIFGFLQKGLQYKSSNNLLTSGLHNLRISSVATPKLFNFYWKFRSRKPSKTLDSRVTKSRSRICSKVRILTSLRFSRKGIYRRRGWLFSRKLSKIKFRFYLRPRFPNRNSSRLRLDFSRNYAVRRFSHLLRLTKPLKSGKARAVAGGYIYKQLTSPKQHLNLLNLGSAVSKLPLLRPTQRKLSNLLSLNNLQLFLKNPLVFSTLVVGSGCINPKGMFNLYERYISSLGNHLHTNLVPSSSFKYAFLKKVNNSSVNTKHSPPVTPWYYNNIIRFVENVSGKKVLFQFYTFMAREVPKSDIVRYKFWMPRMAYYERKLGHRFFLEEAVHILHLGFALRDPTLIANWLKSMILRISFWRTRSIFRFLKYLLNNYFLHIFKDLGVKGLKLKLKGKISVAGNARKRAILFRVGKTSHSSVSLRALHDMQTINTFTGVMGFQVWLFY